MAVASNLYLNAFLSYELYKLLQSSHHRKKHPPPAIARVLRHATISYGLGIFIFFLPFLVSFLFSDKEAYGIVDAIPYSVFVTFYVAIIPLSVVVYITYKIYKQELLRSTESLYGGRLRILVVYFARILVSDLLLWIPAVSLYYASYVCFSTPKILTYNTSLLFTAFQSIVFFGCSIAKPDTRKLVADLVSCRCRGHDDGELSRRCSIRGSIQRTDPYLWRIGAATPEHDSVTEAAVLEEAINGGSSSRHIVSGDDGNNPNSNSNDESGSSSDPDHRGDIDAVVAR